MQFLTKKFSHFKRRKAIYNKFLKQNLDSSSSSLPSKVEKFNEIQTLFKCCYKNYISQLTTFLTSHFFSDCFQFFKLSTKIIIFGFSHRENTEI